jgi:predicted Ser/Thr protein kinase
MNEDNLDTVELYHSILEKKNTYVVELSDIIQNHYRVDVLDIIRKKRIPAASKGMKVIQLRDALSFVPLTNQKVVRFDYETQVDYSPFKNRWGSSFALNKQKDKKIYIIADICHPETFQPQLVELEVDEYPETYGKDVFAVDGNIVDGLYLVNELWKTSFREQLFPHNTSNYDDDPKMASDLFLSLYIQIPDFETSVERQRLLYNEEKLKYLKSINQSYGYNIDEIAASKATSLPEGTLLYNGKYKVLKRLRSGGFGKTYKAIGYFKVGGKTIKSEVAIKEFFMNSIQKRDTETLKVVTPLEKLDEVFSSRKKFMVEAEKIKQFSDHPHIVDVYDVFDENDTCYYTMEYIEGGSLMDYVEQTETCTLQEEEALKIIREVASALSAMHSHRMNHLDVKPENILMSEEGKAVLIDFGAAHKFSNDDEASSLLAITSGGFSPIEIGLIKDFSPSTDIYSLGATLYWLLTGDEPPREGLSERDEKPDYISEKVWKALSLSLRTYREDRPQSIEEFLALLD